MYKKLILFIVFQFSIGLAVAQKKESSPKLKSSSKLSAPSIEAESEWYFQDAKKKKSSTTESIQSVEKGLKIALEQNDKKSEARAYFTLAQIFFYHQQFDLAYENMQVAQSKNYLSLYPQDAVPWHEILATCFEQKNRCKEAIETRAKLISILTNNLAYDAWFTQSKALAKTKWQCKQNNEAINDLKNLLQNKQRPLSQSESIEILNLLGDYHQKLNQADKAKMYYARALNLSKKNKQEEENYESADKLSKIYTKEKKYDEAIKLRSGSGAPASSSSKEMSENQVQLAEIYLEQDKAEEAIPLLEKSVDSDYKLENKENSKTAYKNLAIAYSKLEQHDKALQYYKKYTLLQDAILTEKEKKLNDSVDAFKKLVLQYNNLSNLTKDIELTKQTIANLKSKQALDHANMRKQQILIYSLLGGLMLLMAMIYLIVRSNKLKRKANQILLLKSLRSQMNPHFIFNSLNSVNHFILQNKELEANKFLADFSNLMRTVMENSQQDFISLSQEIELLKIYLKLEHQRFEDKFDYEISIDNLLDIDSILIPPMLIQPFIENAIWHGLRYKMDKGFLKLTLTQHSDSLLIKVEDNGIGRKKSAEIKTKNQQKHSSTGIKNTTQRIALMNELYDTKMQIEVQDLEPSHGTEVKISIALKSNSDDSN
jgi:tetratricopeptide (TPR) repeat protein